MQTHFHMKWNCVNQSDACFQDSLIEFLFWDIGSAKVFQIFESKWESKLVQIKPFLNY
jgi:hypothetical protein